MKKRVLGLLVLLILSGCGLDRLETFWPNFGAYQGEGALEPCTFVSNGGLTGITMYGYVINGAR